MHDDHRFFIMSVTIDYKLNGRCVTNSFMALPTAHFVSNEIVDSAKISVTMKEFQCNEENDGK